MNDPETESNEDDASEADKDAMEAQYDFWTGNYRYILTKKQVTTRPEHIWPEHWSSMSKGSQRGAKEAWGEEQPHKWTLQQKREEPIVPVDDQELDDIMKNARRKLETRSESAMPCEATATRGTRKQKNGGLECREKR